MEMMIGSEDVGERSHEWPELWLFDLEAEIRASHTLEEAKATWREYEPLLNALHWDDFNEAWLRLHRLARLNFCRLGSTDPR
jgi:hypothetical protein